MHSVTYAAQLTDFKSSSKSSSKKMVDYSALKRKISTINYQASLVYFEFDSSTAQRAKQLTKIVGDRARE